MSTSTPRVDFVSLGCLKALVGFKHILTQLRMGSYEVVPTYEDASVVVVNTCGFIDGAKTEFLETIGETIAENGKVIITGCMGVEEHTIRNMHPNVLMVTGPQQYEQVVIAVHEVVLPKTRHNSLVDLAPPQGIKLTPRHYTYLKIPEGCDHSHSFCIIPPVRDKLVSRSVGDMLSEAGCLIKTGVKELLVIFRDTSAYGVDPKYKIDFQNGQPVKTRMKELCEAPSSMGVWVRLHHVYLYPNIDNVIPLMAASKFLPYLNIPSQHASPEMLKAMERLTSEDKTLTRTKQWHEVHPELTIRSTLIVGFSGETEESFRYLLGWLMEAQLNRVGCLQYSPVRGASASELGLGPAPDEVKQDRWKHFVAHQQAISAARPQPKVGREIEVLIDEVDEQGAVGHSWADAPEIDGNVSVDGNELEPGDKVRMHITDVDEYGLRTELV